MDGWTVVLITVGSLVGLAMVGLLVTFVAFAWAYGKVHENMRFAYDDVTVSSCRLDTETRRPVAGVRIASRAARPGTYTVYLAFRSRAAGSGKAVAAGKRTVVVKDLLVGATASERVVGPVAVPGSPECELVDVTFLSTASASASGPPAP